MSNSTEKLANNRSIAILDAATKGGYGIVAVCCVSAKHHIVSYPPELHIRHYLRDNRLKSLGVTV
jgi:hypothetical protein